MIFASEWLALREAADARARDGGLMARLAGLLGGRAPAVLDLGAGTGASLRALAPLLGPGVRWTLAELDPVLIGRAAALVGPDPAVALVRADLARDLEVLLARGPDLVTGSALIDLCSAAWLDRLAAALPPRAALWMALAYDGRELWEPAHAAEPAALAAFHAHQRRDKGFGPALGPDAAAHLAAALRARGREVLLAPSPWRLGPGDGALVAALAEGAAAAVAETGALDPATLALWRAARAGARRVEIGHLDLLALPLAG